MYVSQTDYVQRRRQFKIVTQQELKGDSSNQIYKTAQKEQVSMNHFLHNVEEDEEMSSKRNVDKPDSQEENN